WDTFRPPGFPPGWRWTGIPCSWPTAAGSDRARISRAGRRGTAPFPFSRCPPPVVWRPRRPSGWMPTVSPVPPASDVAAKTAFVMDANGFRPRPDAERPLPAGVKHVVLIVKENRTSDEVFEDIPGPMGMPEVARFGSRGYVDGKQGRLSIRYIDVTPNHHALASQWAISDNFYADSDVSVDGHHW